MEISLNYSGENLVTLMRKIGYFSWQEKNNELSFVRPLERSGYPRFHIYLAFDGQSKTLTIKLHLDQKKPIYKGATAHSGEYEGSVVEAEAGRIKKILETK
jgi:hypothetical protein